MAAVAEVEHTAGSRSAAGGIYSDKRLNDGIWQEGKTFSFRFRLFGILPFGIHTIRVIEFDHAAYRVYTNETNSHVPVWNHRITLNRLSSDQLEYTDEVEIYAGWKTSFVVLWARWFYAHRQRKWRRLLQETGLG